MKPIPMSLTRNRRIACMLTEAEHEVAEELRLKLRCSTLSDLVRDLIREKAVEVAKRR